MTYDVVGGIDYISRAPIIRADIFNVALPALETNLLVADITHVMPMSSLRIYICVSVAGILRISRTQAGVPLTEDLNSGDSLVAGASFMFDVLWGDLDRVNLRYSVSGGTILRLLVNEMGEL